MLDTRYTKAISTLVSAQNEISTNVRLTGSSVEYSLCDRTSISTKMGNYFVSVGLPTDSDFFPMSGTTSLAFPELQQLNVDKIIIAQIPHTGYSEYIDARSIEIVIPIHVVSNLGDIFATYKLYSSTYSSDKALKYGESSPLLGDNIAYLFSDDINKPYTGITTSDIGQLISCSGITSWNPTNNIIDRPSAISYKEVKDNFNTLNTDRRTGVYAVSGETGYPETGYSTSYYNYDVPVGFVILDKGIVVFTHTSITDNFDWESGYFQGGTVFSGGDDLKNKIHFGTNDYSLSYTNLDTEFKSTAVCMALNGEFYLSNNPTWDRTVALSEFGSFNPLSITEVGLYNALGELIAVAKFSEPVQRSVDDIFVFSVDINF